MAKKQSKKLFHEDTNTVTPSDGIKNYKFDPKTHKYGFSLAGNTKVGRIATWSTPMGDYTYKGMTGVLKDTKGTCGNCGACKAGCYVRSSYRFPGVIHSQAVNAWGLRNELPKVESDLAEQIRRHHLTILRINQSGELENEEQMAMWCRLASAFPESHFYIYTKMYDIAEKFLKDGLVPENFTINYSVWHDVGVKEYERVKDFPNVKAFVYDDGVDMCLPTKCYCPAYKVIGKSGKAKMDHSVTCETCALCITSKVKVIGCHDH